jgi:WD40 repeat protein
MRSNKEYSPQPRCGSSRKAIAALAIAGLRLGLPAGKLIMAVFLIVACAARLTTRLNEPGTKVADPSPWEDPRAKVEAVAFSPDGQTLAFCGQDASVCLWNLAGQADALLHQTMHLEHDLPCHALAFSPNGTYLAAAGDRVFSLWQSSSGHYEPVFEMIGTTFRCLAFSPDGKTLALGGDDGLIRLWARPAWQERAILLGHKDVVRCLAFSPDGRRLVSSGQDRMVVLWDTRSGKAVTQLSRPGTNPVQLAAFSPDGKTIAIGEISGVPHDVCLLDSETGCTVATLSGHANGIRAMAFAPDSRTLATAGPDGCIKLWNLARGIERETISDRVGCVKSLAFSPDGTRLAFADVDSNVTLFQLTPEGARLLSRLMTRPLRRHDPAPVRPVHS